MKWCVRQKCIFEMYTYAHIKCFSNILVLFSLAVNLQGFILNHNLIFVLFNEFNQMSVVVLSYIFISCLRFFLCVFVLFRMPNLELRRIFPFYLRYSAKITLIFHGDLTIAPHTHPPKQIQCILWTRKKKKSEKNNKNSFYTKD